MRHIYRQLLRVFAHIYHAHFKEILHLRSEPHFNSLFAHYLAFGREYDLFDAKDLKGTRELWLVYGDNHDGLRGFSDADWGSSTEHRHSISGYVFTLDGGAISWSSKKQNVVALSSTEAEYIALTHATKEAIWLRYVLADVLHPDLSLFPVRLSSDNRSAIPLAKDNTFHPRTKHIDIRYHFIREAVDNRNIALEYRRTEDMPADLFTKALPSAKLEHLSRLFGLRLL